MDANDLGVFLCSASNRLGCQGEFGRREEGCDKEILLTAESKAVGSFYQFQSHLDLEILFTTK